MGVFDKLRRVGNYVRRGWPSMSPDSYFQYKQGRERQRKQTEQARKDADRSAELEHKEAQRVRGYEERYAAERKAEEPHTEAPQDDTSKRESPR
jgi:hypothetical protein